MNRPHLYVLRPRSLRDEITDLPNLLTLARIALLPVVLVLIDPFSRVLNFLSAAVFCLAAATDALDGYLARKRQQVTVLGQFLDPLADKLFVIGVLIFCTAHGRIAAWLVVVLVSREIAVMGLRSIATHFGIMIAVDRGGKIKMALQTFGLIGLLVHFPFIIDFHITGIYLLYISMLMSIWSFGSYMHVFIRATRS
jgi:CDP-diacylglycerol--glycerol-3-phosphate 3-phosphatidyltransferase